MLKTYIGVAIGTLIDLGVGDEAQGFTTEAKIEAYKKKIADTLDEGLKKLLSELCTGDKLTKEQFVTNVTAPNVSRILTTHGFRGYITAASAPPATAPEPTVDRE
jgi:hypothetical protein